MDSLISAAARALQAGDILGALKRVALREDAPALALRGIALAQLGDLDRARVLLRRAERAFGPREVVARARCVVAQAEIALVSRDLGRPAGALAAARQALAARGDGLNAAHAGHLEIRLMVLLGRLDEAERLLADLDPAPFPPAWRAAHELVAAGIAMRRLDIRTARGALDRAQAAADRAPIPALRAEIAAAVRLLDAPAARRIAGAEARMLRLDEVEALLAGPALVVDACRHVVRQAGRRIGLASRPVLFALARTLAQAWPADAGRDMLVAQAFRAREADESHRARLRVEIGRLRRALRDVAAITATRRGFLLVPQGEHGVTVLAPPVEDEHAAVLAFLADGEAWSSSALALALGTSQRTVQRALEALQLAGKAQASGSGRARRWIAPPLGFTTTLLLPGPLPGG